MLTSKASILASLQRSLKAHFPPTLASTLATDAVRTPAHAVVLLSASENPALQAVLGRLFANFTSLKPSTNDYEQIANESRVVKGLSKGCLVHNFLQNKEDAMQFDLVSNGPNLVLSLRLKGEGQGLPAEVADYYKERGQLVNFEWDEKASAQTQAQQLQNRIICSYKL